MSNRTKAEEIIQSGTSVICIGCNRPFKPNDPKYINTCPACINPEKTQTIREVVSHAQSTGVDGEEELNPNDPLTTNTRRAGTVHPMWSRQFAGHRIIGGKRIYFPNKMEANLYRYYHFLQQHKSIANFQFQPNPFDFRSYGIKRGITTYRPDFLIINNDGSCEYIEAKGFMDKASKTKLNRMRSHFPRIRIRVIDYPDYRKDIAKQVEKIIKGWEK